MYCTYCHKEVNSPHRCEETVNRTAHVPYVSPGPEFTWHTRHAWSAQHGYRTGAAIKEEDK